MSKKMNKLVLLSALMIAIIGTFGTVSAEVCNLIADGGDVETAFPVGVVEVTNDDEYLYVTYTITESGWLLNETHLHIANESEEGIPQTKKGNPKVGQFDYSEEHEPCVEYTYVIPLDGLSEEVYIAAHAAVDETVDGTTTYESAWGEGDNFEGKNWAMYFTYTIPSATLPPAQVKPHKPVIQHYGTKQDLSN